tara:strand:+ start:218 stop:766 length:549 start_codon:yes stop_codon:yes gene_type:complete
MTVRKNPNRDKTGDFVSAGGFRSVGTGGRGGAKVLSKATKKKLEKKAKKVGDKKKKEDATPPFKKKTVQRRHIKKEKSKELRKGTPLNQPLNRALKLDATAKAKKKVAQTARRFAREDESPKIYKDGVLSVPKKFLKADKDFAKAKEKAARRVEKIKDKQKKVVKKKRKRKELTEDAKKRRN